MRNVTLAVIGMWQYDYPSPFFAMTLGMMMERAGHPVLAWSFATNVHVFNGQYGCRWRLEGATDELVSRHRVISVKIDTATKGSFVGRFSNSDVAFFDQYEDELAQGKEWNRLREVFEQS